MALHAIGSGEVRPATPVPAAPHVGRAGIAGAVLGFVIAVVGVTLAGSAAGMGVGGAFALSLFVGIWGGVGFGLMTGATLSLALHTDREAAEPSVHPLAAARDDSRTDERQ